MPSTRTLRVEQAHVDLRQRIISGAYPPGAPLSEAELARSLHFSRTPIREALSRLLEEGYVERIPGRGYYVTRITLKRVQDTFEVRRLLETQAAGGAALRHEASALRRLRQLAPVPLGLGEAGRLAAREANARFHLAVAEASGNAMLVDLVRRCLDQIDRFMAHGVQMQPQLSLATAEHLEIVDAIGGRDAASASQAMARHLDACRQQFLRALVHGEGQDIAV